MEENCKKLDGNCSKTKRKVEENQTESGKLAID